MIKLFNESNIGKIYGKHYYKYIELTCSKQNTWHSISIILWQSALLVKETGVSGEKQRPVLSHWQTLSHNIVSSTPRHARDSNYHTITTTITPQCPVSNPAILKGQKEDNVLKPSLSSLSVIFMTATQCQANYICLWAA
jgi:hypothetical protein